MLKKSVLTLSVSLTAALSLLVSGAAPASAAGGSLVVEVDPVVVGLEGSGRPVVDPSFSKWWCEVFHC